MSVLKIIPTSVTLKVMAQGSAFLAKMANARNLASASNIQSGPSKLRKISA